MSAAYSERRRLLDAALREADGAIRGIVVEIGGGRRGRRGRWVPPTHGVARWWTLDVDPRVAPDVAADVERLPVRGAVADTAVCLEVLEYVRRPDVALAELHRVLRPGGHLLLSVPFVHRMDTPRDRWRLSEAGLRDALVAAGFVVVAVRAQGQALTAIAHLAWSAIGQRPGRLARGALGLLALPLLIAARLEARVVPRGSVLATASTGYLAVARK